MHAYMHMRILKRYVYELWDSGAVQDRSGLQPLVFGIQAGYANMNSVFMYHALQ